MYQSVIGVIGLDWKRDFQHTSSYLGVIDQVTTYYYIIYVYVVHRVISLVSKFSEKHPNYIITFK